MLIPLRLIRTTQASYKQAIAKQKNFHYIIIAIHRQHTNFHAKSYNDGEREIFVVFVVCFFFLLLGNKNAHTKRKSSQKKAEI